MTRGVAGLIVEVGGPRVPLTLVLVALLTLITGCPPPGPPIAPRTRGEALDRVNANLAQIDRPLQCKGLVSFKFRDADERVRRFIGHEASLIYQPPQQLRLDVRSPGGVVAEFGSNLEQYWLWTDVPDIRKLWWGEWQAVGSGATRKLAIPPDELLDALILRPLSRTLGTGPELTLRCVGDDHRLMYVRVGPDGRTSGAREVRLDAYPPHQPVEIIDRRADGGVVMHALLRGYRRVGPDGPYIPRGYVVMWPETDAEFRLDVHSAKFRPDLEPEVFDFPAGWTGERERLDDGDAGFPGG